MAFTMNNQESFFANAYPDCNLAIFDFESRFSQINWATRFLQRQPPRSLVKPIQLTQESIRRIGGNRATPTAIFVC
ncbi:MAG: hypothetical protein COT74_01535 [Bdellovibrionales bacterium CG10_big_fil_rev_8_21_14_0_10_45_34]|nr:MAG: hypothetical protein COT74_01535 [Bdellovibrionales bacterium CG10_big_fil_rev_8_21_14_0_10_45_34]